MKLGKVLFVIVPVIGLTLLSSKLLAADKPRVIVSTDIGGSDPDDHQSMVHYLVYADRFDTEGLISSPPNKGRLSDVLECIDAYEKDYDHLRAWSADYPTPDSLRQVAKQGAIDAQPDATPTTNISEGAQLIIDRAKADDERPLYVLVWGSITDVAQAVHKDPSIKEKLRVYSIGSWNTRQDPKSRDYLFREQPDLWWIESDTTFRGMYRGGEQEGDLGNRSFPAQHIKGHGQLGALYMQKKADIKMGDTPSVLYLLSGDAEDPTAEHWGGAYIRPHASERPYYWHDDPEKGLAFEGAAGAVTVNKWRSEYLRDWQARMERIITGP